MSEKKAFKDLSVGEVFTFNGISCEKIPEKRISCCRCLNAKQVNDSREIQINPLTEVETAPKTNE